MEAHAFQPKEIINEDGHRGWEKQEWETQTQYDAFVSYLRLGARRTLKVAAGRYYENPNGLPSSSQLTRFKKWSRENHWRDRARLYDEHLEDERRLAAEEAARHIGYTHSDEVRELMDILLAPARAFKARVQEEVVYSEDEEPTFAEALQQSNLSLTDLWGLATKGARLYATLASVERVTHGLPTSIAERKVDQRMHHSGSIEQRGGGEREQVSERLRASPEGRQAINGLLHVIRDSGGSASGEGTNQ
jgi:hypothetical protein